MLQAHTAQTQVISSRRFHDDSALAQTVLVASVGLMVTSFLPASGLFMEVGFVLAERVLYLPRYGGELGRAVVRAAEM